MRRGLPQSCNRSQLQSLLVSALAISICGGSAPAAAAGPPSASVAPTPSPALTAADRVWVAPPVSLAGLSDGNGVDLYAPIMNWMDDKPGFGAAYEGSQRANYGATVWWYQSCMAHGCTRPTDDWGRRYFTGWPTMQVDADGSRYRAQEWLSYLYGVSGMFYFETTGAYAKGDPWVSQDDFGAWGDGNLFYPGTPAKIGGQTEIPIESLRMKGIRDGEQDYELLVLARAKGHGPEAWEIARSVFPRTFEGNATPQALEDARQKLAALIGG